MDFRSLDRLLVINRVLSCWLEVGVTLCALKPAHGALVIADCQLEIEARTEKGSKTLSALVNATVLSAAKLRSHTIIQTGKVQSDHRRSVDKALLTSAPEGIPQLKRGSFPPWSSYGDT